MTRKLAVIGTAGGDKTKVMDATLWFAMCEDLRTRVNPDDEPVSGGAAWADHLAVHAYLQGWCGGLRLYLPAPLLLLQGQSQFEGTGQSSGSAANWYHGKFSKVAGVDTIAQIEAARKRGAVVEAEPSRPGFGGMFARNRSVSCGTKRPCGTLRAGDADVNHVAALGARAGHPLAHSKLPMRISTVAGTPLL